MQREQRRRIVMLRHSEPTDDKTGLTERGLLLISTMAGIVGEHLTNPRIWVSPQIRSQETAKKFARLLGWEAEPEIQPVLDIIKADADAGLPGCQDIWEAVVAHRKEYGSNVGQALMAAPGGPEYMKKKAKDLFFLIEKSARDLLIIGHENAVMPVCWWADRTYGLYARHYDPAFGFRTYDGDFRFTEGSAFTMVDGYVIPDPVRILRNPLLRS